MNFFALKDAPPIRKPFISFIWDSSFAFLGLTILSRGELTPTSSVIDKIEKNTDDAPKVPENNN